MNLQKELSLSHGVAVFTDYPARLHTTYGTGGNCDYFIKVSSIKGLNDVVESCKEHGVPYKFLANGTNVLLADKGYRGALISTLGLNWIKYESDKIRAGSGALLKKVICLALSYDLYGGEYLIGIPASVGGALCMNAGAYGKTVSDIIESVTILKQGALYKLSKNECEFGYRKSIFLTNEYPIVEALFSFDKSVGYDDRFGDRIDLCTKLRNQTQPQGKSCGSVFKNPAGDYAGRIIESCGLKGYGIGNVSVSQKHANFIIAKNGASSKEIYALMQYIKNRVYQLTGITLEREVQLLGEFE